MMKRWLLKNRWLEVQRVILHKYLKKLSTNLNLYWNKWNFISINRQFQYPSSFVNLLVRIRQDLVYFSLDKLVEPLQSRWYLNPFEYKNIWITFSYTYNRRSTFVFKTFAKNCRYHCRNIYYNSRKNVHHQCVRFGFDLVF